MSLYAFENIGSLVSGQRPVALLILILFVNTVLVNRSELSFPLLVFLGPCPLKRSDYPDLIFWLWSLFRLFIVWHVVLLGLFLDVHIQEYNIFFILIRIVNYLLLPWDLVLLWLTTISKLLLSTCLILNSSWFPWLSWREWMLWLHNKLTWLL